MTHIPELPEETRNRFVQAVDRLVAAMSGRNERNAFDGLWREFHRLGGMAGRLGFEWVPAKRMLWLAARAPARRAGSAGRRELVLLQIWVARQHSLWRQYACEEWTEVHFRPAPPPGYALLERFEWIHPLDPLPDPLQIPGSEIFIECVDGRRLPLPPGGLPEVVDSLKEWRRVVAAVGTFTPPHRGPYPPFLLYWNGKPIRLSPLNYRLVDYMWEHDHATFEELTAVVWDAKKVEEGTIRAAVSRFNTLIQTKHHVKLNLRIHGSHVVKEWLPEPEVAGVATTRQPRAP